MLRIKLQRIGKKHQPSYRLVVAERKSKLNSQSVEDLGWFEPKSETHHILPERVKYWMSVGAQATPTVHNLLVRKGIISGKKLAVHNRKKVSAEAGATAAK